MSEHIKISGITDKERRRRRRELLAAAFCFLLIAVLTWVELKYIGSDSYLYLGLLNLNFILLLVILFIVTRNGVKLLLERRRKVLGSKLRTRLVLAFISLTLIPMALMFLVSIRFVQTSVDYWFTGQVDESMVQTLELGRTFFRSAQDRLERRGTNVIDEIVRQKFAWGGKGMNKLLDQKKDEYDLSLLLVVTPKGTDQNVHMAESWKNIWESIKKSKINWKELTKSERPWSTIVPNPESDLILCVLPVDKGKTGFLVLGETVGQGISHRLDRIVRGLDEYKKLKTLKYPWKMTLYLTLGVMTMLIILGAVWFGFRLAKEISAPIQALAAGTERIARGDLSVRLEDRSGDELGFLVQSFNRMVEDLESSQLSVQKATDRLGAKNLELEQHYRYVEAVLNNITSGVVSMDASGRIGTVNTAAENMLGVPGEFLVGKKPGALLSGDFANLMQEAIAQMAKDPDSQWQRQLDLATRDGMRRMLVSVVSLKTAARATGIVAVFEDITELEKIHRLAAWREVARRIAHEIKNPLTPIKLSAQRLQRNYAEQVDEKVFDDCTELIVKQVERLQNMVSEFSAYAKLPEVQPRPDYMAPVLDEVVAMFANTHRSIEWKLEYSSTIGEIPFDREAIRKVLINIFTNAAEALDTQEDAKVTVVAGHDRVGGVVTVEIRDNGPGLPDGSRSRLFEPYFSRKKGGTGLGLTIVRSIISDHRGKIKAETLPKGGTAFVLQFPDK